MAPKLAAIVHRLIAADPGGRPLAGFSAEDQFDPRAREGAPLARGLGAAFLLALTRGRHAQSDQAREFLQRARPPGDMAGLASFLARGLELTAHELERAQAQDPGLAQRLEKAERGLGRADLPDGEALRLVWGVLFPEGLECLGDRAAAAARLRRRRAITNATPNPDPVARPGREVLFTANALLSPPPADVDPAALHLSPELRERLAALAGAEQRYWYDHPIPIGAPPDQNEILHGLGGLARALAFERSRRAEWRRDRLTCVCSVSVTHDGLQDIARDYITELLGASPGLGGLDIHLFTELETDRLKREVMIPAARRWRPGRDAELLEDIVGVDGEYGRHYSFLKAVSAWWQVLVDPGLKATFKIDLDQVFPQAELVAQTGLSAFEHLANPLWGGRGRDSEGEEVELGLIAGALVNRGDIRRGLFTPDVPWPRGEPRGDETVFFSALPQALSTEAEMMLRYGEGEWDGRAACLQRVHVTGGTNGILTASLRRHRPFTPTFIGRAEDQAYLLSVLFQGRPRLRYLHQPLIMRHDKADLIPEAIAAARTGKIIGDYIRILWFSRYGRSLPWGFARVKQAMDPFTGCFISALPLTLAYLRLTLKAGSLFARGGEGAEAQALDLLLQGGRRLGRVMDLLDSEPDFPAGRLAREREGWRLYYDVLDSLEAALAQGDDFARELRGRARRLARDCRVRGGRATR